MFLRAPEMYNAVFERSSSFCGQIVIANNLKIHSCPLNLLNKK